MDIKVLTINIAGVQFDWFGSRKMALINAVHELRPDIVFLQETTIIPAQNYDQSLDIAGYLELNHLAFAPYGNHREHESPRLGGVAILSRWPFSHVQTRNLPAGTIDTYGARVGIMAEVRVVDKKLTLGTTHLSWRPQEEELRREQARYFLEMFKTCSGPLIFGGDFNASPDERVVKDIQGMYRDIYHYHHQESHGVTWGQKRNNYIKSTWRGDARIDYLFCSEGMETLDAEVVLNKKGPVLPSDHYGVLAQIRI